ncbi:hypothetical protein Tco_0509590 [Tanacetum coccineum]
MASPNVGFKQTKQVYRPVSQKNSASTSGKKNQGGSSRQEVSNLNPFDALNLVENDDDLGTNGGNSKVTDLAFFLLLTGLHRCSDSESDVEVAYDETTQDYDIYDTYDIEGLSKKDLALCDMMDINLRGRGVVLSCYVCFTAYVMGSDVRFTHILVERKGILISRSSRHGLRFTKRTRLTLASLEMCIFLKDHLDAAKCIQHISNLEGELDIEQLHDVEVETGFAISLSDEEINLDEAASEARLSEAGEEKLTLQQALN